MKPQESLIVEAVQNLLAQSAKLGIPDDPEDIETECHALQYLHEAVNELFASKVADLVHFEGIRAAFRKIHSYKYVDDPTLPKALDGEMASQGIPKEEREKVLEVVPKLLEDLKKDGTIAERDAGWNSHLDEVIKVSQPELYGE